MKHYIFLAIVIFSASCTPIPEWSVSNPCDPAYSGPLECNPQDTNFPDSYDTGTIDLPDISLIADVDPVYGDDAEITGDTGQQDAALVQDAETDPPDTYEEDGGDLDEDAGPDTDVDDDTGPVEVDDAGPADAGTDSGIEELVDSGPVCELTLCGDECVDIQADGQHCGECFHACDTECVDGECIVPVTGVSLPAHSLPLVRGQAIVLPAEVEPEDATDNAVLWTSSDSSVASVNSMGVITALSTGTATITVYTNDGGFSDSCVVTVRTPVVSVDIEPDSLNVMLGESVELQAIIAPPDADNQNITWSTDNPAVANVNEWGVVTAAGLGQAIITATTEEGGKTAQAAITVQTAPGIWYDIDTGLMWENPPEGGLGTWQEADEYCSSLQLAGHDNWRLPTISELRTLVQGWPATEPDGECRITDECVVASCFGECTGTTAQEGQCLWADDLVGECQEPFYSSISHNENYMLVLVYDKAMVAPYHRNNNGHFRCTKSN